MRQRRLKGNTVASTEKLILQINQGNTHQEACHSAMQSAMKSQKAVSAYL